MTDMTAEQSRTEAMIWLLAAAVAALGTWTMFQALPGINWGLWTTAAALGVFRFLRVPVSRAIILPAIGAIVIAFGAAVTADEFMNFLTVLSVIVLLAFVMLLSPDPRVRRITPGFFLAAPIVAFASALMESLSRVSSALNLVRSDRARSVLRGLAITLPVIIVFGLLLSTADPIFADLRKAIEDLLSNWDFIPRTVFFFGLLAIVLGAYGFSAHAEPKSNPLSEPVPRKFIGSTERLILFTSIAVLFWMFLGVQLSYLFGNLPRIQGSGMTFADYARRGFGELTIVATVSVGLILVSERFGQANGRLGQIRSATFAVLIAVLLLLFSAFNRVLLYEQAYGFTTARLYAQAYMLIVGAALLFLGWEMRSEIDPSQFFRRTFTTATIAFIVLLYWNHHAWIANKNIDRVAATGKLDTAYLTRDLAMDAVPTLVERLPTLPEPMRSDLQRAIIARYANHPKLFGSIWYEWNVRRSKAADALRRISVNQPTKISLEP
jgi:hypothetical protein